MSNYNIKMAAQLSGVTELSIRSWEGRYSALNPDRTKTNRRLYSDSDIEKLILLKKLTQYGHRIGNLANLTIPVLSELLNKVELTNVEANNITPSSDEGRSLVADCIDAIRKFDDKQLMILLNDASIKYSQPDLIEKVIFPLMKEIGDYWKKGLLRVSHEHFTSSVIVKFVNGLSDGFQNPKTAPKIIVTTPEGQYHEVGALIGASLAASDGWRPVYLGASLPAEEIAATVKQLNSRCIFLSIVYPDDNLLMNSQLKKLREMVGESVFILASGNATTGYKNVLSEIGAFIVSSPSFYRETLKLIRAQINLITGQEND